MFEGFILRGKKEMPKNHELKVKYGKEEREKLQKKADSLGLKISTYIRMVSLNANFNIKEIKIK